MHLRHWGFHRPLWVDRLDVSAYVPTPSQDEGLARLEYLRATDKRLAIVSGPAGCGKSLLLALAEEQARTVGDAVARLSLAGLDAAAWLETLLGCWGVMWRRGWNESDGWRMLESLGQQDRSLHRRRLLLLDDAEEWTPGVAAALLRLLLGGALRGGRCTIVLGARPEFWGKLPPRWLEGVELHVELHLWSVADVEHYLTRTLERAGASRPLFEPASIARLHDYTDGAARKVQQLADMALVVAAGERLERVTVAAVDRAAEELAVPSGPVFEAVADLPRVQPVRW